MHIKRFVLTSCSSNCYVASSEETNEAIIIDPGEGYLPVCEYIEKNGLKITSIVLTHCHFDHILGCNYFKEKYNIPVCAGKTDAENMVKINKGFGDVSEIEKITVDRELNENDIINIGNIEMKVINTPGHTAGGICLYGDDVIFTGDTLFLNSVGRTDFASGDFGALIDSVDKILKLNGKTKIYPGHGFSTSVENEKKSNPYAR